MTYPYALSYLTVPGVTPPEQTYMAARTGYDLVSYRLFHLGVAGEPDISPTDPQIIRDTKRALAETGLKCFDIELLHAKRIAEFGPEQHALNCLIAAKSVFEGEEVRQTTAAR